VGVYTCCDLVAVPKIIIDYGHYTVKFEFMLMLRQDHLQQVVRTSTSTLMDVA